MNKPEEPASVPVHQPVRAGISQEFLREYLRDVFLVAFCITGNRAESQEIAQEAFIGVLQRYSSVGKNPSVAIEVRESAISSAIKAVRRDAIESAETAVRGRPFPRGNGNEDPGADAKWGERVVVLLHDTQSLQVRRIAELLDCPKQAVVSALLRARRDSVPAGTLPHPQTGSHVPDTTLLLAQSASEKRKLPFVSRRHIGKCLQCQSAMKQLSAAAEANRRSALDELRAVEALIDWPLLEREMTGNIAVGVAAARCIQHVHRKRRSAWRMALFTAALSVLFTLGWMAHVPAASTRRLLHALSTGFALHRISNGVAIGGADRNTIYADISGRKVFAIDHPESATIRLSTPGRIQATFFDPDTAEVIQDSLWTQSIEAVPFPVPFLHVNIPAGAPISIQDFSIIPQQRPVRRALDSQTFRVSFNLRNTGTKSLAAVVFGAAFQNGGVLSRASFAAEGLNLSGGATTTITSTFDSPPDSAGVSAELTLDFMLFSDLTSFGSDTPDHRALIADEVASRSERDYLRRIIDAGQLAAARRELAAAAGRESGLGFSVLDRPNMSVAPVHSTALDWAPLALNSGWSRGELAFTLFNRSSRAITWYSITVASFDSAGRLLFAEDVPRSARIEPLQTISVSVEDRLRSTGIAGAVARRFAFVRAAQFADGTWWVANSHPVNSLPGLLALNSAQVRLGALFRRGGLAAVQQDLDHAPK